MRARAASMRAIDAINKLARRRAARTSGAQLSKAHTQQAMHAPHYEFVKAPSRPRMIKGRAVASDPSRRRLTDPARFVPITIPDRAPIDRARVRRIFKVKADVTGKRAFFFLSFSGLYPRHPSGLFCLAMAVLLGRPISDKFSVCACFRRYFPPAFKSLYVNRILKRKRTPRVATWIPGQAAPECYDSTCSCELTRSSIPSRAPFNRRSSRFPLTRASRRCTSTAKAYTRRMIERGEGDDPFALESKHLRRVREWTLDTVAACGGGRGSSKPARMTG